MYLEHFGLYEPPFRITPVTEFFFSGANRGEILDALIYSLSEAEGIIKVSGEIGSIMHNIRNKLGAIKELPPRYQKAFATSIYIF
jgi:type II secretory pathway predicted ATPase ExeA